MQSSGEFTYTYLRGGNSDLEDRTGPSDCLKPPDHDLHSLLTLLLRENVYFPQASLSAPDTFHGTLSATSVNWYSGPVATYTKPSETCLSRRDLKALLRDRLALLFDEEHVEDCVEHPAQAEINEALNSNSQPVVLNWIVDFASNTEDPDFAASVIRCVSREDHIGHSDWRSRIVASALSSQFLEVRDAGVHAAESWGGANLRSVLMGHYEPVDWLRDYMQAVISDLDS